MSGGAAAEHLGAVARGAAQMNRRVPEITDAALLRLTAYSWPGNVRQLLNAVQNMTVMGLAETTDDPATLDARHIPDDIRLSDDAGAFGGVDLDGGGAGGSLAGTPLEQLEKRAIRETLRLTGGNREQTAKLLGIGERTLYRKLKEYGLR